MLKQENIASYIIIFCPKSSTTKIITIVCVESNTNSTNTNNENTNSTNTNSNNNINTKLYDPRDYYLRIRDYCYFQLLKKIFTFV